IHVRNFPSPGYLLPKTQGRAPAVLNHPPIVQRLLCSRRGCNSPIARGVNYVLKNFVATDIINSSTDDFLRYKKVI
ncbi:hypothetical protein, partial [Microcoleus sp. herbarium2]|uniref:hypothetical protein n=1 Tax=Microcoleus sp. herbarium2 TaxID=3055433 RepID=UPI002FD06214